MCHWHIYLSPQPLELNLAKPNRVLGGEVGKTLPHQCACARLCYDFADAILSHRLLLRLTSLSLRSGSLLASSADISKSFGAVGIRLKLLKAIFRILDWSCD